jgi:molecular chaperone GrpE (heat shock protein)
MNKNNDIKHNHRFLDESGDTTFYGKGRKNILGTIGVSNCFIIGMLKIKQPLHELRKAVNELQQKVANDPFFDVASIREKKASHGYYFHAKNDLPEVRKIFLDFIRTIDCSFEAVVGRKSIERYETKHKGKEQYFYADMLSHLLKNKLRKDEKLVLHIAERGKCTKNNNLELALEKAKERIADTTNLKNAQALETIEDYENFKTITRKDVTANILFNVTQPIQEPLLNIADYFCWALQNVFEKGEVRFYNFLKEKISLVVDVYDVEKYEDWKNYYGPKNPLTTENKISPQLH